MTFTQALAINVTALKRNLPNIENNAAIPGETSVYYQGFGQTLNSANTNDVAYFFADYAENSGTYWQVLNSERASSGGYKLAEDIVKWAGDNEYLEESELQAWADSIGYTGNIQDVMQTMSEMDHWLYGDGTLELVLENEIPQEPETGEKPGEDEDSTTDDNNNSSGDSPVLEEETEETNMQGKKKKITRNTNNKALVGAVFGAVAAGIRGAVIGALIGSKLED